MREKASSRRACRIVGQRLRVRRQADTMGSMCADIHPLRSFREQNNNMTQGELAELLGVSRALVSHIECGIRRIDPFVVREWSEKTGIPREKLCPEVFGEAA